MTQSRSIIVPAYRSEATLPDLYARLADLLAKIGAPFEIIFVEASACRGREIRIGRVETSLKPRNCVDCECFIACDGRMPAPAPDLAGLPAGVGRS